MSVHASSRLYPVFVVAAALCSASWLAACGSEEEAETQDASGPDAGEPTGDSGVGGDGATLDGVSDDGGSPDGATSPDAEDNGDAAEDAEADTTPDIVPTESDLDGDGILNTEEGTGDADGDGIPNSEDPDSDNDGIPDIVEGNIDSDGDGTPDYLDLDSDNDGIPDDVEGNVDSDGDGQPDYRDRDSDGDGLLDEIEGSADTDGDGTIDRLDTDSDNDFILDLYDGAGDVDEDGIPNFQDTDSDGDGWDDSEEYGQVPGSGAAPYDRDLDGFPDFVDLDSDADGLLDEDELGCPDSTERSFADSDGDGYSDLLEVAFGTDDDDIGQACDPTRDITDDVDFFFELDFGGPEQRAPLDFQTAVRNADVAFNMDTTGSMSGSIDALKRSLSTVLIPELEARLDAVGYAVTQFDDFPCNGHGSPPDLPLLLRQRVTSSSRDAQAGVNALALHNGSDYFESGFESLFQIATGLGRNNRSGCMTDRPSDGFIVPPFDAAVGYIAGVADGEIGGVGFRQGSVPIVVHITDAPSHAKGESSGGGTSAYRYGATRTETYNALAAIGARVIGVVAGGNTETRADLEGVTTSARSAVPTCAWDSDRPASCGVTQCCTGANGSGRAPIGGVCPLVYDSSTSGTGLDTSIISGINALLNFATLDLTARPRRDEEEFLATGIDTSCFISAVVPVSATAPEGDCVSEPVFADLDRDGTNDGFTNVTPGSALQFEVIAQNDCVRPTRDPQVFEAYIDIVEPRGSAVYDTRLVTILVPPDAKQ